MEGQDVYAQAKCAKICDHGINCFINRQLIYNYPEEIFAKRGVMAIEHADFEGTERLAAVLGAEITSTFDRPDLAKLGTCDLIDEIMIGEDKLIRFSGCASGEACTVLSSEVRRRMCWTRLRDRSMTLSVCYLEP